jgi:hypothetical protein
MDRSEFAGIHGVRLRCDSRDEHMRRDQHSSLVVSARSWSKYVQGGGLVLSCRVPIADGIGGRGTTGGVKLYALLC